jgi:hypothetical protein
MLRLLAGYVRYLKVVRLTVKCILFFLCSIIAVGTQREFETVRRLSFLACIETKAPNLPTSLCGFDSRPWISRISFCFIISSVFFVSVPVGKDIRDTAVSVDTRTIETENLHRVNI